jgi:hypothetical protein
MFWIDSIVSTLCIQLLSHLLANILQALIAQLLLNIEDMHMPIWKSLDIFRKIYMYVFFLACFE